MEAVVVNFRRGRHRQKTNQLVLQIKGSDDIKKAEKFVGKKVVFTSPAGKQINGEISAAHGNSGAVRARFERGLPGQLLGRTVKVE